MPNMTPEEARTLLDRLKQAGNVDDPVYAEAADAIIPMLETIAGMTYEYAVQARLEENGQWHQVTEWNADPNPYKPGHTPKHNERLVRRLVGPTETVGDLV